LNANLGVCGIIGYIGPQQAVPILLEGLRRLEYRGYDSAGIAVMGNAELQVRKLAGRVDLLADLVASFPAAGTCGIAHTRWATHGAPTQTNAHPHLDCRGDIALIHNGVIENADVLRERLEWAGHHFTTETDTEALVHLIEDAPVETLEARVLAALEHVEGTYGLAVVSRSEPDKIVVACQGSPLLLGIGPNGAGMFVASDAAAIMEHTRSVVYLNDGDVAVLRRDGYQVLDADSHARVTEVVERTWSPSAIELRGFPHFMLKEIREQPDTTRATLRGRLLFEDGTARLNGLKLPHEAAADLERVVLLGCGSSWHAALAGRDIIESLAHVPVQAEYASEYRYRRTLPQRNTLTIAISQSGETADTLEAMRVAQAAGSRVLGIVNVVGSTIARESDGGIYLHAGPEIGVASTKAFTSQLVALTMFGLYLGRHRGMSAADGREVVSQLAALPELVAHTLAVEPALIAIAEEFSTARNFLCMGRGANFPVALEGALKLKEISYIHAEGYPAAEMKHGPIALIDNDMPVVVVAPRDAVYSKVRSNIEEVRALGGRIIVITTEGNSDLSGLVDHQVRVPAASPLLSPVLTVIPLQLLAYHIAVLRGCDVDKPRNLVKSVRVE
jgi:glucosamine--fructose-6-phosphate aminotransferase (isomerizing)